jgi:hypothetical protein
VGRANTEEEVGEAMSKLSKAEAAQRDARRQLEDALSQLTETKSQADADRRALVSVPAIFRVFYMTVSSVIAVLVYWSGRYTFALPAWLVSCLLLRVVVMDFVVVTCMQSRMLAISHVVCVPDPCWDVRGCYRAGNCSALFMTALRRAQTDATRMLQATRDVLATTEARAAEAEKQVIDLGRRVQELERAPSNMISFPRFTDGGVVGQSPAGSKTAATSTASPAAPSVPPSTTTPQSASAASTIV